MASILIRVIITAGLFNVMCTTKVSEWVLQNHAPEDYTLFYQFKQEISEQANTANQTIEKENKAANIRFRSVRNDNVTHPYYTLYYRNQLIGKFENQSELNHLTESPLRDKIANEIMMGKLCVMLYLETGIQEKDTKGLEIVRKTIASSPFTDIITLIGLNRHSVEESHFISMLLHVEDDLMNINEPMLFGIFGRFRALEPLLAGGISEENIGYMIDFLTADCSCLIKDDLPGADILYTNKWKDPPPALVNEILNENPSLIHR